MTDAEKELRKVYLWKMIDHKFVKALEIFVRIGNLINQLDESKIDALYVAAKEFDNTSHELMALYEEYKQLTEELNPDPIPGP